MAKLGCFEMVLSKGVPKLGTIFIHFLSPKNKMHVW